MFCSCVLLANAIPMKQNESPSIINDNSSANGSNELGRFKRQVAAIGVAAAAVGIADSYKNDGVVKDVVDFVHQGVLKGETDRAQSVQMGGFGGDGSY